MNIYIMWTEHGIKIAAQAETFGRAERVAISRGHKVISWVIGQRNTDAQKLNFF